MTLSTRGQIPEILYEVAGTKDKISFFIIRKSDGSIVLRSARKWSGERPPLPTWDKEFTLGEDILYSKALLRELLRNL